MAHRSDAAVSDKFMASSPVFLPIITVDDTAAAGVVQPPARRLPPWLRRNLEPGGGHGETAHLIA